VLPSVGFDFQGHFVTYNFREMGERRVFPHSPWIIDKHFRDAYEEINDAQTVHVHGREQWTVLDYENKKRVAQIESGEEQVIRYSVIPWHQHFSLLLS
jgi:hypothetical protein